MRLEREEYEAFCDSCMIVVPLLRAAYNDMKAAARTYDGTEDEFEVKWMEAVRPMARRAYRAAKKER